MASANNGTPSGIFGGAPLFGAAVYDFNLDSPESMNGYPNWFRDIVETALSNSGIRPRRKVASAEAIASLKEVRPEDIEIHECPICYDKYEVPESTTKNDRHGNNTTHGHSDLSQEQQWMDNSEREFYNVLNSSIPKNSSSATCIPYKETRYQASSFNDPGLFFPGDECGALYFRFPSRNLATLEPVTTNDMFPGFKDNTNGDQKLEEKLKKGHTAVRMPNCNHVFGRSCIVEWLKGNVSCPLCRKEVEIAKDSDAIATRREEIRSNVFPQSLQGNDALVNHLTEHSSNIFRPTRRPPNGPNVTPLSDQPIPQHWITPVELNTNVDTRDPNVIVPRDFNMPGLRPLSATALRLGSLNMLRRRFENRNPQQNTQHRNASNNANATNTTTNADATAFSNPTLADTSDSADVDADTADLSSDSDESGSSNTLVLNTNSTTSTTAANTPPTDYISIRPNHFFIPQRQDVSGPPAVRQQTTFHARHPNGSSSGVASLSAPHPGQRINPNLHIPVPVVIHQTTRSIPGHPNNANVRRQTTFTVPPYLGSNRAPRFSNRVNEAAPPVVEHRTFYVPNSDTTQNAPNGLPSTVANSSPLIPVSSTGSGIPANIPTQARVHPQVSSVSPHTPHNGSNSFRVLHTIPPPPYVHQSTASLDGSGQGVVRVNRPSATQGVMRRSPSGSNERPHPYSRPSPPPNEN